MATTWNPADRIQITLTNGNLTAAPTSSGGVRSIASANANKCYFEVAFANTGSSAVAGIVNATAVLNTVPSNGLLAAYAINSGATGVNGVAQSGNLGAFTAGSSCCVAVDIGGRLIWFRRGAAGTWNASGTADPAAGIGGYSVAPLGTGTTALYAYFGGTSVGSGAGTANFGATGYVGVPPSGFVDLGAAVAGTQAIVMVLA